MARRKTSATPRPRPKSVKTMASRAAKRSLGKRGSRK